MEIRSASPFAGRIEEGKGSRAAETQQVAPVAMNRRPAFNHHLDRCRNGIDRYREIRRRVAEIVDGGGHGVEPRDLITARERKAVRKAVRRLVRIEKRVRRDMQHITSAAAFLDYMDSLRPTLADVVPFFDGYFQYHVGCWRRHGVDAENLEYLRTDGCFLRDIPRVITALKSWTGDTDEFSDIDNLFPLVDINWIGPDGRVHPTTREWLAGDKALDHDPTLQEVAAVAGLLREMPRLIRTVLVEAILSAIAHAELETDLAHPPWEPFLAGSSADLPLHPSNAPPIRRPVLSAVCVGCRPAA